MDWDSAMKKFCVLGQKITVKIKNIEDQNIMAQFEHELGLITIRPDDPQKFKSMCHELGHAYWHRTGLYQANRNLETEEIFCETFSNFIADNIVNLYQAFNKLKK